MASQAAGTSAQDRIVEALSKTAWDDERGALLPLAFTREALAEETGLSTKELRAPLANLLNIGAVITRTVKRSGELLFKLKDEHHDAWQSQITQL